MSTNLTNPAGGHAMVNPLRGRPRPPLPLHMVVSRELTAAMRQLRVANGDHTAHTVEILNETITDLYPAATGERTDYGRRSVPHLVTERYVLRLERGHHARLPVPAWLRARPITDSTVVYGSRVPSWLVRAYDVAFGADGYLVDMYDWTATLLADHEQDPPRLTRHLPAHVPDGGEFDYLAGPLLDGKTELDDDVRALLHAEASVLASRRHHAADDGTWSPSASDGSGSLGEGEEALPEGTVVAPGAQLVARWVLHNTGTVPWLDRLLYGVGSASPTAGLRTPPFVTVPDTDPGGRINLRVPLRAPRRPGTYRACLKMGWPNGVYCFPSTLLGVIVTVIVPAVDLLQPANDWAVR
jgi:hypothetical protein